LRQLPQKLPTERDSFEVAMSGISEGAVIYQNEPGSFKEFETEAVVNRTGYSAVEMRSHGCGISALYMATRSLAPVTFIEQFPTVGLFAQQALKLHRNDVTVFGGKIRKVGNPVFNLKGGWYHDALCFLAKSSGLKASRYEGASLEDCVSEIKSDTGVKKLHILSFRNSGWRLNGDSSVVTTHMVVVSGYRIKQGKVMEMCITDSHIEADLKLAPNRWIEVTEEIDAAFTGRFLSVSV